MENRIFELSQRKVITRLSCIWSTRPFREDREPSQVSLEVIDPEKERTVKISGFESLKKLRDELDKLIYTVEAMEVDYNASEVQISDLYGNNMSISYALKHGLLKDTRH